MFEGHGEQPVQNKEPMALSNACGADAGYAPGKRADGSGAHHGALEDDAVVDVANVAAGLRGLGTL